jgi:hypothetical protein
MYHITSFPLICKISFTLYKQGVSTHNLTILLQLDYLIRCLISDISDNIIIHTNLELSSESEIFSFDIISIKTFTTDRKRENTASPN